jgi:hypothetical protein
MVPETEEEEVSISLSCTWMNKHGAKNEFHLKGDSYFVEANITNYIDNTLDMTVDGDGYRLTTGCIPSVSVDGYSTRTFLGDCFIGKRECA